MKEKNKILLLVVYQSSINLNNCMYIIKNNNNSCCLCVCNSCIPGINMLCKELVARELAELVAT